MIGAENETTTLEPRWKNECFRHFTGQKHGWTFDKVAAGFT